MFEVFSVANAYLFDFYFSAYIMHSFDLILVHFISFANAYLFYVDIHIGNYLFE